MMGNPMDGLALAGNTLCCCVVAMSPAIIIGLIVVAVVGTTIVSLRTTARTGMPSKEVLDRATRRAQELEADEKAEQTDGGPADRGD
jgi:hypothetical protein